MGENKSMVETLRFSGERFLSTFVSPLNNSHAQSSRLTLQRLAHVTTEAMKKLGSILDTTQDTEIRRLGRAVYLRLLS